MAKIDSIRITCPYCKLLLSIPTVVEEVLLDWNMALQLTTQSTKETTVKFKLNVDMAEISQHVKDHAEGRVHAADYVPATEAP